jgi:hypothetical protein
MLFGFVGVFAICTENAMTIRETDRIFAKDTSRRCFFSALS